MKIPVTDASFCYYTNTVMGGLDLTQNTDLSESDLKFIAYGFVLRPNKYRKIQEILKKKNIRVYLSTFRCA